MKIIFLINHSLRSQINCNKSLKTFLFLSWAIISPWAIPWAIPCRHPTPKEIGEIYWWKLMFKQTNKQISLGQSPIKFQPEGLTFFKVVSSWKCLENLSKAKHCELLWLWYAVQMECVEMPRNIPQNVLKTLADNNCFKDLIVARMKQCNFPS